MGLVYKLDFVSGKSYIGLTTKALVVRLGQHRKAMLGSQRAFLVHSAWAKYGEPNVSVLFEGSGEELKQAERNAITKYNTLSPRGYNLSIGGDLPLMSIETRKKMGDAHRGKQKSSEQRAKISLANKGKAKSILHRAALSKAQNGRDPATRKDLSKYWAGRKQSAEHLAARLAARRINSLRRLERKED